MFSSNSDFYPTPISVIEQMTTGLDLLGKHVLEPSAGKGDIVDFAINAGAKVMACELNKDLARIVSSKCQLLKHDFLQVTAEEVSHIDIILMNPPFSAEENHILHAWSIAPAGCTIVSLCNNEMLRRDYGNTKQTQIREIIELNGFANNLGEVFSTAERSTLIDIGLIYLTKPNNADATEFSNYFDLDEKFEDQENGIMHYNEIREIVSRYISAVKMFSEVEEASSKINEMIGPIGSFSNIRFGAFKTDSRGSIEKIERDRFKKDLQKSAWRLVFSKFKIEKYVTSAIKMELDAFIEKQQNLPFTLNNIYKMIEMIIGTHQDRFNRVLVQTFDKICSYSSENSTAGEKWKTNSNYKVNRKFIVPWITELETWRTDQRHVRVRYSATEDLQDVIKGLCLLTGKRFEDTVRFDNVAEKAYWGEWFDWEFFRVKGFKKGTAHFEFKDEKVWEQFNLRVAKIKGWQIPQKTDNKTKGTERTTKCTQVEMAF